MKRKSKTKPEFNDDHFFRFCNFSQPRDIEAPRVAKYHHLRPGLREARKKATWDHFRKQGRFPIWSVF